jgi:hypothetical protein
MTEADAKQKGLTRLVYAECLMHDGVFLINPEADLDDTVIAWCEDTGELLKLRGDLWTFEDGLLGISC